MKFIHIAVAGVVLSFISLPLGLMLILIGVSLHFFQKYHTRRLDEAGER